MLMDSMALMVTDCRVSLWAAGKSVNRRRVGFTLIELLVVVSIIALLVAILLPALGRARDQAKGVVCSAQMRQYGLALVYYTNDYDEFPIYAALRNNGADGSSVYPEHTWYNLLAPYVEGEEILSSDPWQEKVAKNERNMNAEFRQCPTGKAIMGVNYGGIINTVNSPYGPFVWRKRDDQAKVYESNFRFSAIRQASEWIAFLDTAHGWGMYPPVSGWALNADWDNDGIMDTCKETGYIYNDGAPKVHSNGFNIVLCDGHVERMTFEDFLTPNHRYWTNQ